SLARGGSLDRGRAGPVATCRRRAFGRGFAGARGAGPSIRGERDAGTGRKDSGRLPRDAGHRHGRGAADRRHPGGSRAPESSPCRARALGSEGSRMRRLTDLPTEPMFPSPESAGVNAGEPQWPVLDPAALEGLAGEFVKMVEPHTESDPVAILVQLLAAFGSLIGRSPYFPV